MLIMPLSKMIKAIKQHKTFEAQTPDNSLYLKVDKYIPYICTAIHNGSQLRESLRKKCLLLDEERFYEEDPSTGDFIFTQSIVLIVNDSRYEYDLNRSESSCIYEMAWGKKVWKHTLSDVERTISLKKHKDFYRLINSLVTTIEKLHNYCIVFDIHSYNYKRLSLISPTFNIGSHYGSNSTKEEIPHLLRYLNQCKLTQHESTSKCDKVFLGKGYLSQHIHTHFNKTMVFPIEIKKIYMDENTGEIYPDIISEIQKELSKALVSYILNFSKRKKYIQRAQLKNLLKTTIDPIVEQIDVKLYRLVKGIEVLNYVNPINFKEIKDSFFKNNCKNNPTLYYKPLIIDPYQIKQKLYRLPVQKIKDYTLQSLYIQTINHYADLIDLISSLGTPHFLYNSLRCFGEPTKRDLLNAQFLMHTKPYSKKMYSQQKVSQVKRYFENNYSTYGIRPKVKISKEIVAGAMVKGQTVLLNKSYDFDTYNTQSLFHHEVGVHLVTTMNAKNQPLKIFSLGLPNNVKTQEGLAVASEYLSGYMSHYRLKKLACRVIAVHKMLNGLDFAHCFQYLHEELKLDSDTAFYTTMRIYRGGGFTKDFLYLRGFSSVLQLLHKRSVESLFIGKTSMEFIDEIEELIDRKIITSPKYKNINFSTSSLKDPIIEYLVGCIT